MTLPLAGLAKFCFCSFGKCPSIMRVVSELPLQRKDRWCSICRLRRASSSSAGSVKVLPPRHTLVDPLAIPESHVRWNHGSRPSPLWILAWALARHPLYFGIGFSLMEKSFFIRSVQLTSKEFMNSKWHSELTAQTGGWVRLSLTGTYSSSPHPLFFLRFW